MKQISCEICGSSNLIKNDNVFVCQQCGARYSLDAIKKMASNDNMASDFSGSGDSTSGNVTKKVSHISKYPIRQIFPNKIMYSRIRSRAIISRILTRIPSMAIISRIPTRIRSRAIISRLIHRITFRTIIITALIIICRQFLQRKNPEPVQWSVL